MKDCPCTGGLGDLVIPLIVGTGVPLPTAKATVFDGVPPTPFLTCAVKEPAAKTAEPLNCVEVLVSPETTQDVFVGQPGPRKNTSAFEM